MALTLAEASKLSNDILLQGVVETIVKESPILQVMPFIEIVGNGLTYNQEKTLIINFILGFQEPGKFFAQFGHTGIRSVHRLPFFDGLNR